MSTTSTAPSSTQDTDPEAERYPCSYPDCEENRPADAVGGSYCSADCFYRHKGRKAISEIKRNHKWCATCFRPVKSVLPPDEDCPDFAIGWQFPTEHTTHAEHEATRSQHAVAADGSVQRQRPDVDDAQPADRVPYTRWSCECGNVDLSERDELLEMVEIKADRVGLVRTLLYCLYDLHADGVFERPPDRDRLFDAIRENYADWEYAAGRALHQL